MNGSNLDEVGPRSIQLYAPSVGRFDVDPRALASAPHQHVPFPDPCGVAARTHGIEENSLHDEPLPLVNRGETAGARRRHRYGLWPDWNVGAHMSGARRDPIDRPDEGLPAMPTAVHYWGSNRARRPRSSAMLAESGDELDPPPG